MLSLLGVGLAVCLVKPHLLYANPTFGGGSGTESDPYRLSTPEHLTELQVAVDGGNNFSGKHFVLTNDIDFSGYDNDNNPDNGNFNPIGYWNSFKDYRYFSGNIDGKHHTISNLQIVLPNEFDVGLFVGLENAKISNLNLEQVEIQGRSYVGGIAGEIRDSIIKKSSASGEVLGVEDVGGLVGYMYNSSIEQSSASGEVSGVEDVGGLVGYVVESTIEQSSASGDVIGRYGVGGLIGCGGGVTLIESFSQGQVNGVEGIGGLIGEASQPLSIVDCYSLSDITGDSIVGGLVGSIDDYWLSGEIALIKNSYYEGVINGAQSVGKLIAQLGYYDEYDDVWYEGAVSMENVYVNQEKNSNYPLVGDTMHGTITKEDVEELTTIQMTHTNSQNYMTALDFENVWTATSTTPMFQWQKDLMSANRGDIQINGNVQPMIADVTIPSVSPDLVIDPNSPDGAMSPEFGITNDSTSPIKLDLRTFEQTTSSFNDVLPDKYDSWKGLNKKQSQDIALGLVAKEGDGWHRLTTPASYVANHQAHEIGVVRSNSTVSFEFEVHHGRAFSEAKTVQYKMVFVFDLLN